MTTDAITQALRATRGLTPAQKMELADRLYDAAVGELEAAERSTRTPGNGHTALDAASPVLEPWAGFSERRLSR